MTMPVLPNLSKGHIDVQSICWDCEAEEETIYHLLIKCTFAQLFWLFIISKINKLHPVTWSRDLLIAIYVHRICVVQYFVGCGQSGWQETKETLMSITQACRWRETWHQIWSRRLAYCRRMNYPKLSSGILPKLVL
jgi:hypothetical protein